MKLIDSKGRLFGKISILDLGAALIMVLVLLGIFVFPSTSVTQTIAQTVTKPIEVDLLVRGLSVKDADSLYEEFKAEKTNIIIRNNPAGQADITNVQELPRNILVTQPDGTVKILPDPRPETDLVRDMIITLGGQAQVSDSGMVLGGQKVKIGTPIELEGTEYNFNTSVIEVRTEN